MVATVAPPHPDRSEQRREIVTEQTQANQSTEDEEDFYDDATASFPAVEHLAPSLPPNFGPGRLVAIWALKNGTGKGTNGLYAYTETITLALDNGPNGDQVNEMVPAAPFRVDMRHSTGFIQGKLKGRVDGKNTAGVRLKYRPLIGRVNTQASSNNKNVPAYGLSEPTDADHDIVQRHKAMIISINKELEAKDKQAEDDQAFS